MRFLGGASVGSFSEFLSARRIVFVTGKGGVGKSMLAATMAADQARLGRRVLLAEIGDSSYFKDFFGLPNVGYQPTATGMGFDLALWNGERALREYVLHYLKVEKIFEIFFENKVMRSLINIAPGLSEIAILGKITSGIRQVGPPLRYDLLVIDCYATGHALSLLRAPQGLIKAIPVGPMGHQSREIEKVIRDSSKVGYVTVTLLEEMPIVETLEFCRQLRAEFSIEPRLVANKVLTSSLTPEQLQWIKTNFRDDLGEFADYVAGVSKRQSEYLRLLADEGFPPVQIPLILCGDVDRLMAETGEALRKV